MDGTRPDPTHEATPDETPVALRHLAAFAASCLVALAIVYLVPPLHRFRPWAPGDPWPFASYGEGETIEAIANGGAATRDESEDRERLEETLGAEVAANLESAANEAPVVHGAHVDPHELEGLTERIVDPTGEGMRPFYEALLRTANEDDHAITRIAHYGDSSIATDLITHTVRRRLQQRFGDAGHGFVLISKGYLPYMHRDLFHVFSPNWQVYEVTRRMVGDGRYGFGGIQVRGGGGAKARFGSDPEAPVGKSVSRFELLFQRNPRGGQVELTVDGGTPQVVDTHGDVVSDDHAVVEVPDGDHQLVLRALGAVTLYGMILEREGPGVVYDSLGLVGARANRLLNFDRDHVQSQIRARGTNLLVLGFGGNEASDSIDPAVYEREFTSVIETMRGGRRDLGCLVVAPLDQAERAGAGVRTFRAVPVIVEAQRRVAARMGCAFFDTFHAMGGSGAMARWYRSNPRLAMGDFRHATPEGYEVIGNMLYKAMLAGFAEYLRHPARP